MKTDDIKILTTLKSYFVYEECFCQRMCYVSSPVEGDQCSFSFQLPCSGRLQWRMNTDFALEVTDVVCVAQTDVSAKLQFSEDAREVVLDIPYVEAGTVTVNCKVRAFLPEESIAMLKNEYSCRLAHIQLLLENERKLCAHIQQANSGDLDAGEMAEKESQLKSENAELMSKNARLNVENAKLKNTNSQINSSLNLLNHEMEELKDSKSWKIGHGIIRFGRFFVPEGSRRALCLRVIVNFLRHPGTCFHALSLSNFKRFWSMIFRNDVSALQAIMWDRIHGIKTESIPEDPSFQLEIITTYLNGNEARTAKDFPVLQVPQFENPQVSIVIPVYNQFHYTYSCVASILKNSGDISYEIIIANDCSTDLTKEINEILPGVRCITNRENLRFLRNCNNAAKYAKGQYILFLNNDTQVQKNWLEPLVTLIESSDDIGMVGSKLLYPDGHLQEAGGILWQDGSAWNYGNGQDADLPEFNYVKETDYISGASIMLKRKLWLEIGGFDEHFAPAYCEDSDLAFTVRKMGYRVMYQPLSNVVHFEGVSNGTDTSAGQKRYQIENTQKFYEKWKDELSTHPENGVNVFTARDRSYGKKTILVVDHYVPTFDKDAGSRTVYQYLQLFVNCGFNVKFIGDNFYRSEPYTTCLQQLGIEVLYGAYYAQHWQEWILANAEHFDYVLLNRPHIAPHYLEFIRQNTHAKIFYYGHDLCFLRAMREYEVTGDPKFQEEAKNFKPHELSLMRQSDMSYYPSEVEVREIHKLDPAIRVKAIPAYLFQDVAWESYDFADRKDIMFIGGFLHRPNVDAVKWLAEEIMPELVRLIPDVKVHVLGSNAPQEVLDLATPNLIMEGFVTDDELVQFYRRSRISLVPLRYGAGIKGKVIEAMRYGTPVVTTPIGAEGIEGAADAMLVEEDGKVLAQKMAELYQNPDQLTKMSQDGVAFIKNCYSPKNAISILSADIDFT